MRELDPLVWGTVRTVHLLATATSQDGNAKALFIRFHALGAGPETIAMDDPVQVAQLVVAARRSGGEMWPGHFTRLINQARVAQANARGPLRLLIPGGDGA